MRKILLILFFAMLLLSNSKESFAVRDWEYWSRYSVAVPLSKQITYYIKPEWRVKEEFYRYLFKLENAVGFKLNDFIEIAPYYVWLEKKTIICADRSDLFYLDVTASLPLKDFFDLKFIDRARYQYNFDKETTIWRNSLKVTRNFKITETIEFAPFLEDEIFYDTKVNAVTENWASSGLSIILNKNISLSACYLLDSIKKVDDWQYANVIVSSFAVKF
ncbi:secreted protein [Candidatus Omnitrophus magneticus]|uniref:Secreted protein n=1 Tax=Candidatus Omnitrophus magneticus TaxID=1609969 RepID=A0A0F0CNY4_9BACT|nr:secreted protein [Candidatus Omnitrophus magneticus]